MEYDDDKIECVCMLKVRYGNSTAMCSKLLFGNEKVLMVMNFHFCDICGDINL